MNKEQVIKFLKMIQFAQYAKILSIQTKMQNDKTWVVLDKEYLKSGEDENNITSSYTYYNIEDESCVIIAINNYTMTARLQECSINDLEYDKEELKLNLKVKNMN